MTRLIKTSFVIGAVTALVACEQRRAAPEQGATPEQYGSELPEQQVDPDPGPNPVIPAGEKRIELAAEVDDFETVDTIDLDGHAKLTDTGSGVQIVLNVEDAPAGTKAVHIHEKGDCSNVAGKSMGNHFAPKQQPHGLPSAPADKRHLGDLGNMQVGSDGKGRLEITVPGANLKPGDPLSFVGKALVVHESDDKGASKQPSGGAGNPMACGVIEAD